MRRIGVILRQTKYPLHRFRVTRRADVDNILSRTHQLFQHRQADLVHEARQRVAAHDGAYLVQVVKPEQPPAEALLQDPGHGNFPATRLAKQIEESLAHNHSPLVLGPPANHTFVSVPLSFGVPSGLLQNLRHILNVHQLGSVV